MWAKAWYLFVKYWYYLFNVFVVTGPLVLLSIAKDKVRINVRAYFKSFLYVSVPFIVWDMWAASNGHWGFYPKYIVGPYIFGLPLEELLFFTTVPFAMCFIWELLGDGKDKISRQGVAKQAMRIFFVASIILAVFLHSRAYTRSVLLALALTMALLAKSKLYVAVRFWRYQMYHFLVFVLCNYLLTSLPIITYSSAAIIGYRIGTIPLEDFFYSFSLMTIFVIAYTKFSAANAQLPLAGAG